MNPRHSGFSAGTLTRSFGVAAGFLVLVFLMGGSARASVLSLVLLRPLAIFAIVTAYFMGSADQRRAVRVPLYLVLAIIALVAIQLIPLPPGLWQALPGRALEAESFGAVGMAAPWMPISMAPFEAWNSFFSLSVPLAALLLAANIDQQGRSALITLMLCIIGVSALLGFLQVMASVDLLYFYDITNHGNSVGLFANRNHQAAMLACAFPLLAGWAALAVKNRATLVRRLWVSAGAAAILVPMVIVTGSRGGLFLTVFALILASIIIAILVPVSSITTDKVMARRVRIVPVALFALLLLVIVAFWFSGRGTAFDNLVESAPGDDLRVAALPTLWQAIQDFFPFGSGAGSFVSIYQTYEPHHLLSENYFNHAHNDLVEVALEFGLAGIALMATAAAALVAALVRLGLQLYRTSITRPVAAAQALAGAAILLILGVGSIVDYPLRTPSVAAFAALAAVWLALGLRDLAAPAGGANGTKIKASD